MREIGGIPIVRKITSMKNLIPSEQNRLKRLKKIFRGEGRIPPETTLQEMKYLLRLEAGRKQYRRKRWPTISNRNEWEEAMKKAYPFWDHTIEETLTLLSRKRAEENGMSEK